MWSKVFTKFAGAVARISGKPLTFALSVVLILAWAVSGPYYGFSDTWQLVINTGTTIVTFLMVFLMCRAEQKIRPPGRHGSGLSNADPGMIKWAARLCLRGIFGSPVAQPTAASVALISTAPVA